MRITLALIILFAILYYILPIGLERNREYQCAKWNEQATMYPAFYWTPSQIDQCWPDTQPLTDIPWRNDMQKYNLYPEL